MPCEEDWLLRPVTEGMCSYESLLDGRLDLGDVAAMNDALDVRNENDARVYRAAVAKEK